MLYQIRMKYITVITICVLIAYCSCSDLVDYRLSPLNSRALRVDGDGNNVNPPTTAPTPTFKCTKAGLQCSDCEKVVNCLDMGDSFLEIPTATCSGEQTCNNGTCSKEANHKCGGLSIVGFKCSAIGMFPNPADCQKFYICYKDATSGALTASEGTCPESQVYDMTRTYCSLKLDANKQCPASTKVPTCEKPGATFVLANKSIFGMCLIDKVNDKFYLVPRLYVCPNGGSYTPATYRCA